MQLYKGTGKLTNRKVSRMESAKTSDGVDINNFSSIDSRDVVDIDILVSLKKLITLNNN